MKKTIGFIRVRNRKLSPRSPETVWGTVRPTAAASYDIVRAVRVNGKPRHEFVLGLGTRGNNDTSRDNVWFWMGALERMIEHGLTKAQRDHFVSALVRKGVAIPSSKECEASGILAVRDFIPGEARRLRRVIALSESR